jgi:hypothetical protein
MIELALLEIERLDSRLHATTRHPDRPAGFDDEGAPANMAARTLPDLKCGRVELQGVTAILLSVQRL